MKLSVEVTKSGCWLWLGRRCKDGYARGGIDTSCMHKVIYESAIGPVPDGLELDHLCRVRHCVNPRHLEPVTHAENMRRSAPAQITQCVNGHDYTVDNTYIRKGSSGGKRDCRKCAAERAARYRARAMQSEAA